MRKREQRSRDRLSVFNSKRRRQLIASSPRIQTFLRQYRWTRMQQVWTEWQQLQLEQKQQQQKQAAYEATVRRLQAAARKKAACEKAAREKAACEKAAREKAAARLVVLDRARHAERFVHVLFHLQLAATNMDVRVALGWKAAREKAARAAAARNAATWAAIQRERAAQAAAASDRIPCRTRCSCTRCSSARGALSGSRVTIGLRGSSGSRVRRYYRGFSPISWAELSRIR